MDKRHVQVKYLPGKGRVKNNAKDKRKGEGGRDRGNTCKPMEKSGARKTGAGRRR